MYTEDRDAWWQLEHAFAGHIEQTLRVAMPDSQHRLVNDMLGEDIYQSALSYARGLDQDDLVELVHAVSPELLKVVAQKLEPKPVRNFAWMVVYRDGARSQLFDWKTDAEDWAKHAPGSKVVEVIWEE